MIFQDFSFKVFSEVPRWLGNYIYNIPVLSIKVSTLSTTVIKTIIINLQNCSYHDISFEDVRSDQENSHLQEKFSSLKRKVPQ